MKSSKPDDLVLKGLTGLDAKEQERLRAYLRGIQVQPPSNTVTWGTLTGKPSSVAGYNIGDVYTKNQVDILINKSIVAASGAGADSEYLLLNNDASLPNSRKFVHGSLMAPTDTGPSGTYTLAVDSAKLAWTSGKLTIAVTAGKTLTLAAADDYTLTVPATGTAALGAGTLTVATTSDATIAAHTHAITTSSNPGANARILATDASGFLTLAAIGLGQAPTAAVRLYAIKVTSGDAQYGAQVQMNLGGNHNTTAAILGYLNCAASNITTGELGPTAIKASTRAESGATIGHAKSILASFRIDNGTVTRWDGCYVGAAVKTGGTLGTVNGLYIESQTAGGTANNAIFTNAGLVRLGDQLSVIGSADRVQAIFTGYSTQTNHVFEIQDSAAGIHNYLSVPGAAAALENTFNETGSPYLDLRAESDTEANMVFLDASADTLYLGGTTAASVAKGGLTTTKGRRVALATKAADYTLTANDEVVAFTATATATLPAATGTGQTYRIICRGGVLTIDGNGAETIKGNLTQTLYAGEDLIITDTANGLWE